MIYIIVQHLNQRLDFLIFVVNLIGLLVTMQAQREAPPDMQCKDKFLLQAVIVEQGVTTKDITAEMVGFFPPGCLFSMFMPCYPHSEIL